jgi:hypothetical protein
MAGDWCNWAVSHITYRPLQEYSYSIRHCIYFLQKQMSCSQSDELDAVVNESLTAEREQVRKIHNMSFRHLSILLLQKNTKMRISSVTEEYQDGEKSCGEFFGHVPFLQLAIHIVIGLC